jgi:heme/copper-type cytochrome/quinol oxidase subunit 2
MTNLRGRLVVLIFALGAVALSAQDQAPTARPFAVTARRYRFDPPRIEVFQDDLVRVELKTADIPHSMTIDAYRIAKKVTPGQRVTFEFRADRAGTFPFYCNLQVEDGCRQMRGELVVKPRR